MTGLDEALRLSQDIIWLHFIVFLRVGPIIALFPGFGEQSVPVRIKLALALAMTTVVAPAIAPEIPAASHETTHLTRFVLAETTLGTFLGIGIRLFLLALQTAGSIAAQSTSLSQILGNTGATPLPAMGFVLVTGALALAMMLDLHVRLAEMTVLSYRILPVARMPDAGILAQWGIGRVAHAFGLAFTLAAPFVIVSVLYNLTLGIINRAMPQLMVVFVGAPVITGAALFLLMLLAPTMIAIWVEALQAFIVNPLGTR
ncbi:flagellar biosynthetic protein FliR [Roseovarius azorensis]|uniref:Flagellar biosynthetic protein FliR n=1 Tax=Roseovarius azorensis TaxID=1287727 RepID=A0A1H7R2Z7_9RHOB|nr:flagellar biosynthetic protein FliR [Roseovarius azorensis]SEL54553.1 flagellar biosynthetic protein FliR [Roseovarius azorensis]